MTDIRFERADRETQELVEEMVSELFSHLDQAKIAVVFDLKKRSSGGKYVFGRFQKSNDLIRFLTEDQENPEGYDYILYLDKQVYQALEKPDKKRLIFHELCHAEVDPEKEDCWKIRGHEIETFYDEIEYNSDDPRWGERMSAVAASIYESDI